MSADGSDDKPVVPYTAVPNSFLDRLMAYCTGAEVKALLYIARRTLGTKRGRANGSDAIALSQICGGIVRRDGTRLDWGTGLARAAAVEALYRLEFAGIIERDRGNGRTPDSWRLAAELPATKVQAPEKRFRKRTASGSKSELQTGSETEPPAVQKSNAQKKGGNHHQEKKVETGSAGGSTGGATPRENQKTTPLDTLKADDEKPPARTSLENPEEEFRARLSERHYGIVDVERVLADVKSELGDVPLSEFLAADLKATTAPERLSNPHGHYRKLGQRLGRRKDAAALELIFETQRRAAEFLARSVPPEDNAPKCPTCHCPVGKGTLLVDRRIEPCTCATPEWRAKLADLAARDAAPKRAVAAVAEVVH